MKLKLREGGREGGREGEYKMVYSSPKATSP